MKAMCLGQGDLTCIELADAATCQHAGLTSSLVYTHRPLTVATDTMCSFTNTATGIQHAARQIRRHGEAATVLASVTY